MLPLHEPGEKGGVFIIGVGGNEEHACADTQPIDEPCERASAPLLGERDRGPDEQDEKAENPHLWLSRSSCRLALAASHLPSRRRSEDLAHDSRLLLGVGRMISLGGTRALRPTNVTNGDRVPRRRAQP